MAKFRKTGPGPGFNSGGNDSPSPAIRLSDKPSAEALIKTKTGDRCQYFGDVPDSGECTVVCKADDLDLSLKNLCGKKKYALLRVKELVNNEVAVRISIGSEPTEKLIS
jgi:hypothetical protein